MGQRDRRNLNRTRFSVLFSNFLNFCMSQKAELPSLTGHRTKTRKRDEKKVNDPSGFRDSVIEGLARAGVGGVDLEDGEVQIDLDAVSKFLDTAGNKLDYRRYGEVLLEILIAGGLLAPGGSIQEDALRGDEEDLGVPQRILSGTPYKIGSSNRPLGGIWSHPAQHPGCHHQRAPG